ncbi:MAG TPA: SDR family NAD(P)-dependent oxidoreductase [Candidatus Binataceae bacterium]|nr:SDR family NAD(P)-dependent oxidoreductase [Candidatus Binataceae bacterium]
MELQGKVAIITGGGYGIGREIALAYARAGASVAIAARTLKPLEETRAELERTGGHALALQADVSKEADCLRMVERTVAAFNRLDIMVNNAGIAGPTKRITDMALAEWQEVLDINITGAWLASRAAVPVMLKQGSGNILMISSGAGRRGYPLRAPYAASKWAMLGLTQTLAGELGNSGIRVNCICPGAIAGDRIERVIRARAEAMGLPYEQVKAGFTSMAAMNRMATETEVARVALFLVSEAASAVTGQTINVDAGSNMN